MSVTTHVSREFAKNSTFLIKTVIASFVELFSVLEGQGTHLPTEKLFIIHRKENVLKKITIVCSNKI